MDDRTRRWNRYLNIVLLVVLIGVSVQYTLKVLKPKRGEMASSAVLRWVNQLQAMENGEDIHAKHNYPNPPIMAQMLWPLSEAAQVHPALAALLWFYLKVGMLFLCIHWVIKMIERPGANYPFWAKALGIALSLRPMIGDLTHGNINIFILFLIVGALYAFTQGRDLTSGLLLALSIACKVTPALFVVYFLYKRSWRVLAGCAIGCGLFFIAVPTVFFGVQDGSLSKGYERNEIALTSWTKVMILPYLVEGKVTSEKENQSLPGLLTRTLSEKPSFTTWAADQYIPMSYHNVAAFDSEQIKRMVQACQLGFLMLMAALCLCPVRRTVVALPRGGWRLNAEFSLILLAMLLFSERTWKHHCTMLLLPMMVLCYAVSCVTIPRGQRWGVATAPGVAALLMFATSSGSYAADEAKARDSLDLGGHLVGGPGLTAAVQTNLVAQSKPLKPSFGKLAQVYGAYTWAFLAMMTGLGILLWNARERKLTPIKVISQPIVGVPSMVLSKPPLEETTVTSPGSAPREKTTTS